MPPNDLFTVSISLVSYLKIFDTYEKARQGRPLPIPKRRTTDKMLLTDVNGILESAYNVPIALARTSGRRSDRIRTC